jgi:hypothetical protein
MPGFPDDQGDLFENPPTRYPQQEEPPVIIDARATPNETLLELVQSIHRQVTRMLVAVFLLSFVSVSALIVIAWRATAESKAYSDSWYSGGGNSLDLTNKQEPYVARNKARDATVKVPQ